MDGPPSSPSPATRQPVPRALRPWLWAWGACWLLWGAGETQVAGEGPLTHVERQTRAGRVRGYLHHVPQLGASTERFFAIPFASPPLGRLRFEPPQPPAPWQGVRNATDLPPACWVQNRGMMLFYVQQHMENFDLISEDCLYLNVYVPVLEHAQSLLPVLVHVHGGGNEAGMGAMLHGDVFAILGEVIVVNLNYRLGHLGFLGLGEEGFRGNFGLLDQTAALTWVRDNIRHFGGDPDKVTLQGHSSGGADVGLHVVSPLSRGLFRYAVLQSGFPLSYFGVEQPPMSTRDVTLHMAAEVGCGMSRDPSDVKECLKAVPLENFRRVDRKYEAHFTYTPVAIDGQFLPRHPEFLLQHAPINGQAFLLGVTGDDGALPRDYLRPNFRMEVKDIKRALPPTDAIRGIPNVLDLVTYLYLPLGSHTNSSFSHAIAYGFIIGDSALRSPGLRMAELLSARTPSTFFYNFDFYSALSDEVGVLHGDDLFYLWGYPLIGHFKHSYGDVERDVSREMAHLWAHFVKEGRPLARQGPSLHPFSRANASYFHVEARKNGSPLVQQRLDLRMRYMAFWSWLLPTLQEKKTGEVRAEKTSPEIGAFSTVFICLSAVLCLALVAVSVAFYLHCRRPARSPTPV